MYDFRTIVKANHSTDFSCKMYIVGVRLKNLLLVKINSWTRWYCLVRSQSWRERTQAHEYALLLSCGPTTHRHMNTPDYFLLDQPQLQFGPLISVKAMRSHLTQHDCEYAFKSWFNTSNNISDSLGLRKIFKPFRKKEKYLSITTCRGLPFFLKKSHEFDRKMAFIKFHSGVLSTASLHR